MHRVGGLADFIQGRHFTSVCETYSRADARPRPQEQFLGTGIERKSKRSFPISETGSGFTVHNSLLAVPPGFRLDDSGRSLPVQSGTQVPRVHFCKHRSRLWIHGRVLVQALQPFLEIRLELSEGAESTPSSAIIQFDAARIADWKVPEPKILLQSVFQIRNA